MSYIVYLNHNSALLTFADQAALEVWLSVDANFAQAKRIFEVASEYTVSKDVVFTYATI